jgi:hypothetical protein
VRHHERTSWRADAEQLERVSVGGRVTRTDDGSGIASAVVLLSRKDIISGQAPRPSRRCRAARSPMPTAAGSSMPSIPAATASRPPRSPSSPRPTRSASPGAASRPASTWPWCWVGAAVRDDQRHRRRPDRGRAGPHQRHVAAQPRLQPGADGRDQRRERRVPGAASDRELQHHDLPHRLCRRGPSGPDARGRTAREDRRPHRRGLAPGDASAGIVPRQGGKARRARRRRRTRAEPCPAETLDRQKTGWRPSLPQGARSIYAPPPEAR